MKIITHHPCLSCSRQQESCCHFYVPLISSDIKKFLALGFRLEEFAMANKYSKLELKNEDDWWIKSMVKINGKNYRLTTKLIENDRCFFLKNGVGCILGKDRPLECRIYPFWMNNKSKIIHQDSSCYFFKHSFSDKKIIKLIGEDEKKIRSFFQTIKNDFIKNYHWHKKIIKLLLNN